MPVRVFILLVVGALVVSASVAFYTFYIVRDYALFANVSCNPSTHSCFVGDGDTTPQFYAKLTKRANTIPACNGWLNQCPELACAAGDETCAIAYCSPGGEDTCYTVSVNQ